MSDQKDEQAFEDYLKGNSALSNRYRSESTEEPSARLDAEINAAAKEATGSKKPGAGPESSGPRWYVPLSLAAVIVISFSVVFRIYDKESLPASNKYPDIKIENQTVLEDRRMDQLSSGKPESVLKDEMGEVKEKSESNMQTLKREMPQLSPSAPALEEDIDQSEQFSEQEIQGRSSSQSSADKPSRILMREQIHVPAEPEFRKEQAPLSTMSDFSDTLNPEQMFELINQLWTDGDKKSAYDGLKNFMQAYPDYPVEELKQQLPAGMEFPVN